MHGFGLLSMMHHFSFIFFNSNTQKECQRGKQAECRNINQETNPLNFRSKSLSSEWIHVTLGQNQYKVVLKHKATLNVTKCQPYSGGASR